MAENKVLKGINFPGLEGTYYVPEAIAVEDENGYVEIKSYVSDTVEVENLDTTLTKSGMAADAAEVGKILNQKVDKVDGAAQCLTVEDSLTIKRGNQAEGAYFYTYVEDHNYPTVELLGTANDDFVKLYGIANPTDANDAVNKQYVDTNFAPAGYGLGEEPVYLENADTAKTNGWYWFDENTVNTPLDVNYGTILVKRRNYLEIIQEVVDVFGTRVQRTMRNGTWDEWEFENPPLNMGTWGLYPEYRTTERHNGFPVYVRTLGGWTAELEVRTDVYTLDANARIFNCEGYLSHFGLSEGLHTYPIPAVVPNDNDTFDIKASWYALGNKLYITTDGNEFPDWEYNAVIKYIKVEVNEDD